MKKILTFFLFFLSLIFFNESFISAQNEKENRPAQFWKERYPLKKLNSPDGKKLPLIEVKNNKFINAKGDTILFRGLSIADPDKIESEGYWNKNLFTKAKDLGTMLVRIPVHPAAWRARTPIKYLELLDQAVEWCTELEMYVIIDWHSIGNLKLGLFQDPQYETSIAETFNFWRIISNHFSGNNTVAFYELFNEPTLNFGKLGSMSWDEWKEINEELISLTRSFDKETIPLVATFDWAYDLTPLHINPVEVELNHMPSQKFATKGIVSTYRSFLAFKLINSSLIYLPFIPAHVPSFPKFKVGSLNNS